ncbi:leucyl aminopeptidase [Candidatus Berkelbacteria bacterium]|nr:leucyl aminopeptidase [Candidatus Berkelbacteria bacterium]
MKITVRTGDLTKTQTDLVIVNEFEGVKKPDGATGAIDQALGGIISEVAKEEHFEGKEGESLLLHTHGKISAKRVLVIGLGKKEDFTLEGARRAAAHSVKKAKLLGAKRVASIFHGTGAGGLDPKQAAQAMAEGVLLADYDFNKYQTKKDHKKSETPITEFTIVVREAAKARAGQDGLSRGEIMAKATAYARDLVNEPPSVVTPRHLAEQAQKLRIKKAELRIDAEIFGEKQLEKMGAGGLLGVSAGSDEEGFLIHLHYSPQKFKASKAQKFKKIVLVGKGLTFDSGGLGIKPWDGMVTMKMDMAGAAAILGVFSVLPDLRPNAEVHGVIATTENMLGGKALKPGDVLKTMSGKTIEVLHTDAEGRIVLSDALEFANRLKPTEMIDIATLTGAAIVALGDLYAAIMGNNEPFIERLRAASVASAEPIWPLPLPKDYADYLKSNVADVANISSRKGEAGAIAGGLFLQEFVDPKVAWAHLDIAGPAFLEREHAGYLGKGGTGFGTRLLLEYLSSN